MDEELCSVVLFYLSCFLYIVKCKGNSVHAYGFKREFMFSGMQTMDAVIQKWSISRTHHFTHSHGARKFNVLVLKSLFPVLVGSKHNRAPVHAGPHAVVDRHRICKGPWGRVPGILHQQHPLLHGVRYCDPLWAAGRSVSTGVAASRQALAVPVHDWQEPGASRSHQDSKTRMDTQLNVWDVWKIKEDVDYY